MKQIIMYFPFDGTHLKHPYTSLRKKTKKRQETLFEALGDAVKIYIARGAPSHISGNIFRPQFERIGKNEYISLKGEEIEADLVLGFSYPKEVTRTFQSLSEITVDKTRIEYLLPQYTLRSKICHNYREIQQEFSRIGSTLKVLKPQNGTRGRGIFIGKSIPSEEAFISKNFPYLLQEFFDTSHGFYGIPGIHDFRIIILGGEIIAKILRRPLPGKYISNSHSHEGGEKDMKDFQLPKEIQNIIDAVEHLCKHENHRFYSIDIGIGKDGKAKIFELNAAPGLSTPEIATRLGNYIRKNILKLD